MGEIAAFLPAGNSVRCCRRNAAVKKKRTFRRQTDMIELEKGSDTMIQYFEEFCRELNACGFSMGGGNAKGIKI